MRFRDIPLWRTPYIIAEVGSNWQTLDDCLLSIRAAKACGADAVKFQLFDYESLYGFKDPKLAPDANWTIGANPYLDPIWLSQLRAEADFYGINFMCSAFSPRHAEMVNPYVNIHKVASSEMYHVRLLQELNTYNKPIIMSTAASTEPDIRQAMTYLEGSDVCLMYCVGNYPAKDIDMRNIRLLEALAPYVGYSDHTTDIRVIPRVAVKNGAQIIEKHFTAIKPEIQTPDRDHSLNVKDFGTMVRAIRNKQEPAFLGDHGEECDMILRHKRRLKAIAHINIGDKFVENVNFGAFRSREDDPWALPPFAMDSVNGKEATVQLSPGAGIGPKDFK